MPAGVPGSGTPPRAPPSPTPRVPRRSRPRLFPRVAGGAPHPHAAGQADRRPEGRREGRRHGARRRGGCKEAREDRDPASTRPRPASRSSSGAWRGLRHGRQAEARPPDTGSRRAPRRRRPLRRPSGTPAQRNPRPPLQGPRPGPRLGRTGARAVGRARGGERPRRLALEGMDTEVPPPHAGEVAQRAEGGHPAAAAAGGRVRTQDITPQRPTAEAVADRPGSRSVGPPSPSPARRLPLPPATPDRPYILDFYCAEARLAVEIDGEAHGHPDQIRHDARRDVWLAEKGVRTLRIPSSWTKRPSAVLDIVLDELRRNASPLPGPPPRQRGGRVVPASHLRASRPPSPGATPSAPTTDRPARLSRSSRSGKLPAPAGSGPTGA